MADEIHPHYTSQFHPIRMEMVESRLRNPDACPHKLGEIHEGAISDLKSKLCVGLFASAYRYIGLASVGLKSWDAEDPDHFYISCPCRTGTVWKIGRK